MKRKIPAEFRPLSRRTFLTHAGAGALILPWISADSWSAQEAPNSPAPIPEPHFPDRLHLFVWRNWELANEDRMAQVLGTTEQKVREIGASLGLPPKPRLTPDQLRRIYITVIRQNWHVLSEDQLIRLLGWDRAHYEFTLKEDDFLDHKLGFAKPHCEPLLYETPSPKARRRAAEIKRTLQRIFASSFHEPGEEAFRFVKDLSSTSFDRLRIAESKASREEIDLTGWTLVTSDAALLQSRVRRFQSFLQEALACETKTATRGSVPASRFVQFSVDPAISPQADSFEIDCQADRMTVTASSPDGLMQGIYSVQGVMESRGGPFFPIGKTQRSVRLNPRYLYSYFALYGDPLMQADIDPFPDGYLEKLARVGVNGVWLQAVLHNLAPSSAFQGFGDGWQTRLGNLRRLVERARNFGIRVYLYINEPRAMPEEFFKKYPEVKGTHNPGAPQFSAMCTSVPKVRQWISDSLAHVFSEVPDLGGIFAITMSENLTNCFSKGRSEFCPRCSKRQGFEVVSEVHHAFYEGVRRSSAKAEIIAWDWGWGHDWVRNGADAERIIENLPTGIKVLSVSEWHQPVHRGGVSTKVGEYSISVVGPGPRAKKHWSLAKQKGLATLAKVQANSTWEISAVPYIPVAHLIRDHFQNLVESGIDGIMLSWTVGGYPSPNLEIAKEYYYSQAPKGDEVLERVAARRYGPKAVSQVLRAWKDFSTAFEEFPYGVAIYTIPTQHGPANPLRLKETGYSNAMILFPYDDVPHWAGAYPPEVVQAQFAKMAVLWEKGLESFRSVLDLVPGNRRKEAQRDFGIAETCYLHFQSVANQVQFWLLRKELNGPGENKRSIAAKMEGIAREEIELAKRQYRIARADSRIAFEATNHYYYRPLDLAEKILNCEEVIAGLRQIGRG
ncbi:MAG: hypothetical protein ACR2L2_01585 [Acidobacteriota bacterium]